MKKIQDIFSLLRPWQWIKNTFIFLPMFFGGRLFDTECWEGALLSFIAFSFLASGIYCINDTADIEADRNHPEKRNRAVASGTVSVLQAFTIAIILITAAFAVTYFSPHRGEVMSVLGIYLLLNILYTYKLKHVSIIDVFILSLGFVLRVVCGGIACDITLSPWIILMTLLITLLLAFAKRRDDVVLYEETGKKVRQNVEVYNLPYLDITIGLLGGVTIVSYIMYTLDADVQGRLGSKYIYTTSIFVIAGILRYLKLTMVDSRSGSPTKILLHDRFIRRCVTLWIFFFIILIYSKYLSF